MIRRAAASVLAVVLTAGAVLGGAHPAAAASKKSRSKKPTVSVSVGPGDTNATSILSEVYAQALEARGITVTRTPQWTTRASTLAAMGRGGLDLYPERSHSLLAHLRTPPVPGERVAAGIDEQLAAIRAALPPALTVLTPTRAEDGPAIVCNATTAQRLRLSTVDGLAQRAGEITLGGAAAFETAEPFGVAGLRTLLGAQFAAYAVLDNEPLTVTALRANTTNCAFLTTTDGSLAANGFVALADTVGLTPDEIVVPVVAKAKATPAVIAALDAVSARVDTRALAVMIKRIESDRVPRARVAAEFLAANHLT